MSNPQNETAVRRMMDLLIEPNISREIEQVITSDWYNNDQALEGALGHPLRGYQGFRELHDFWTPFSDLKLTIENIFSEGDQVASYFRVQGRHTREFMGMPPTGKNIDITATGIFRFRDGKVAENMVTPDALGLLMQLGIVQMPGQRKAA